jgi:uncharacterized protein (DUF488 family)
MLLMKKNIERKFSIFTIGHSNLTIEDFLKLLHLHKIQILVDIRSEPYSKYVPHFNRKELEQAIKEAGMKYLFLGRELGGRPAGEEFYNSEGYVLYGRLADSPIFLEGISRLEEGLRKNMRIALMCSEEDPEECHRRLLVARVLLRRNIEVRHIRGNGSLEMEPEHIPIQLSMFAKVEEIDQWKSIRSVLPAERPPTSLES